MGFFQKVDRGARRDGTYVQAQISSYEVSSFEVSSYDVGSHDDRLARQRKEKQTREFAPRRDRARILLVRCPSR